MLLVVEPSGPPDTPVSPLGLALEMPYPEVGESPACLLSRASYTQCFPASGGWLSGGTRWTGLPACPRSPTGTLGCRNVLPSGLWVSPSRTGLGGGWHQGWVGGGTGPSQLGICWFTVCLTGISCALGRTKGLPPGSRCPACSPAAVPWTKHRGGTVPLGRPTPTSSFVERADQTCGHQQTPGNRRPPICPHKGLCGDLWAQKDRLSQGRQRRAAGAGAAGRPPSPKEQGSCI